VRSEENILVWRAVASHAPRCHVATVARCGNSRGKSVRLVLGTRRARNASREQSGKNTGKDIMSTIENSTLYVTHTTAWASMFHGAAAANPDNPGNPGNPNAEPLPDHATPPPERQSPEIPPDFTPQAPPVEPNLPGADPTPNSPDPNPHEPIRVF
jgi:hypothetical protein